MTKEEQKRHDNWEYTVARKKFLGINKPCVFCFFFFKILHPAQVIHHSRGRRNHYLDVSTWIAVCKFADRLIHEKSNRHIMEQTGFYNVTYDRTTDRGHSIHTTNNDTSVS